MARLPVSKLRPFHLTRWLDSQDWQTAGRHGGIASVKRALNWSVSEGLIENNPLKTVKTPAIDSRDVVLEPDELKKISSATDACFRLFLLALRSTGCRPGEISQLSADMVDLAAGTWTFKKHKTRRKTAKPRVVYLTPCMVALSRILMARRPKGPLFLNSQGRPWHRNAIGLRLRRLRKKLGLPNNTVAYAYRHTFATEGLVNGVPVATMAELLGHVDTRMVARHYGHLDKKVDHLKRAVLQATQSCQSECA
jgi:integrase